MLPVGSRFSIQELKHTCRSICSILVGVLRVELRTYCSQSNRANQTALHPGQTSITSQRIPIGISHVGSFSGSRLHSYTTCCPMPFQFSHLPTSFLLGQWAHLDGLVQRHWTQLFAGNLTSHIFSFLKDYSLFVVLIIVFFLNDVSAFSTRAYSAHLVCTPIFTFFRLIPAPTSFLLCFAFVCSPERTGSFLHYVSLCYGFKKGGFRVDHFSKLRLPVRITNAFMALLCGFCILLPCLSTISAVLNGLINTPMSREGLLQASPLGVNTQYMFYHVGLHIGICGRVSL